ncbi:hypothetical protein EGO58_10670 [Limosilactobacillus reuteri]|nr:hypothetical protein EGO58_10670 [Limosilactobacillus reuteri]
MARRVDTDCLHISYCGVQKESMNSHGTFNGEDYPLHVQLDNRTQTNGTVYVEQLISSTQMAIYRNNAS